MSSGSKRKRDEAGREPEDGKRRRQDGPVHTPLVSLHDRRALYAQLSEGTRAFHGQKGVMDMVLEYAGLVWPVLTEHDHLVQSKLELTRGMLDLLPGFHGDDLAVCAYDVLRRHSVTVLEIQFHAGSQGHGLFDAKGQYMCSKETVGPGTVLELLTVGPRLSRSVQSSLCAIETYAELLTDGCGHPWKNVKLTTTTTHSVADLCLRLWPVRSSRSGWQHVKRPLMIPLAGVYRGEWFDRSLWNSTYNGLTSIHRGTWTVRSQPKRDSVRRLVLQHHRGNADRIHPDRWYIYTGDVWHAIHDTRVWMLGFGWSE